MLVLFRWTIRIFHTVVPADVIATDRTNTRIADTPGEHIVLYVPHGCSMPVYVCVRVYTCMYVYVGLLLQR